MNSLVSTADLRNELTRPSPAYRRRAWIAAAVLLGFVAFYLGLAGWLSWKGLNLLYAGLRSAHDSLGFLLAGACMVFLAVFMFKALFFVRRGALDGLTEITRATQPRLFEFLDRLADEARAPRPAKVYVSARVNAAVFYDLSVLNFLFPSRKNLEIGLALVNVLTVSEFKAVLAHEFGHFAQKSMALGRWVYLAQQIAGHLVARRDGLDDLIKGLSRIDIRIAWIGWLLSLIVWAIRAVVDTFFRFVLMAERALSREMEFQADRIAVSLTGSDALIDALYRIQAADTAWDRTLAFANQQLAHGVAVTDLFALQTHLLAKLREVFDDPGFGAPPPTDGADPARHRIFKSARVQVSQMWSTHPAHHEREDNAKRIYLAPPERDVRAAWALFDEAAALRERLCADMLRHVDPPPARLDAQDAAAALDHEYDRPSYQRRYRGIYLARAVTRTQARWEDLYDPGEAAPSTATLYPEELSGLIEELPALWQEKNALVAMKDGIVQMAGRQMEHRGRTIGRRDLSGAIAEVTRDITTIEQRLQDHDRACRSTFARRAQERGAPWATAWAGQLALLHYAEHTEANLTDLHGLLANTFQMVTAKHKVHSGEADRVVAQARALHEAMAAVAAAAAAEQVRPNAATLAWLGQPDWPAALGEFKLGPPARENIDSWLKVIDGWFQPMLRALSGLRRAALDGLLDIEARLEDGPPSDAAPEPCATPIGYATLCLGQERPRQTRLDAWSRFQTADGWGPATLRFLVAGGMVFGLLGLEMHLGNAKVIAYNGLDRPVQVRVGAQQAMLQPGAHRRFEVDAQAPLTLSARTAEGEEIETLHEQPDRIGANYVYNVAGASLLIHWEASYGVRPAAPPRRLGAPRWLDTEAEYIFETPPQSISTRRNEGGGTREVLSAASSLSANSNLTGVPNDADPQALIAAHVRWDAVDSLYLSGWLRAAQTLPDGFGLLQERLRRHPKETNTLRFEQELAPPAQHAAVCARHQALAQADPANADLAYLVTRCIPASPAQDDAFVQGWRAHPDNGWFANAAAYVYATRQDWPHASESLEVTLRQTPALRESAAIDLARLRRVQRGEDADLSDLTAHAPSLALALALRTGNALPAKGPLRALHELSQGRLAQATDQVPLDDPQTAAVLTLQIGASDGASAAQRADALTALKQLDAFDTTTLWPALGLSLREGRDPQAVLAKLPDSMLPPQTRQQLARFVAALQDPRDAARAEAALGEAFLYVRAQAYSVALIAWGERTPASWRTLVRRALFESERPYFTPTGFAPSTISVLNAPGITPSRHNAPSTSSAAAASRRAAP